MNMRVAFLKHFVISFFLLVVQQIHSQGIGVAELKGMLQKKSVSEVKSFLETKGWVFLKKEDLPEKKVVNYSWSYKRNTSENKAVGWMTVGFDGENPVRTYYEAFDFSITSAVTGQITDAGFRFEDIQSNEVEYSTRYADDRYSLWEYMNKDSKKGHQYECIEKYSILDPRNGMRYKYYDSGNIQLEYELKEGVADGVSKLYYENGTLKKIGHWKDDKEDGIMTYFDEKGTKEEDETWSNGILEGEARTYFPNGQVKTLRTYLYGKLSGKAFRYSESGQLLAESNYIGGELYGEYKEYTNGVLSFRGYYVHDKLNGPFTETLYDEQEKAFGTLSGVWKDDWYDGKIVAFYLGTRDTLSVRTYADKKAVGQWRYFDEKGKLIQTSTFENAHATVQKHFQNGKLTAQLTFVESSADFIHFYYELFGKETYQAHFSVPNTELAANTSEFNLFYSLTDINGAAGLVDAYFKNGPYFYQNEIISYSGNFVNGYKQGTWKRVFLKAKAYCDLEYTENGVLSKEEFHKSNGKLYNGTLQVVFSDMTITYEIKNGLRNGKTTEYSPEGTVISVTNYVDGYKAD